jgi:hypothetical protein
VKYCPLLQLFSMIKSEDGIKRRGDFFWSVGDFSFEKDTIGHIFTGQYYGLHNNTNDRYHDFFNILISSFYWIFDIHEFKNTQLCLL